MGTELLGGSVKAASGGSMSSTLQGVAGTDGSGLLCARQLCAVRGSVTISGREGRERERGAEGGRKGGKNEGSDLYYPTLATNISVWFASALRSFLFQHWG